MMRFNIEPRIMDLLFLTETIFLLGECSPTELDPFRMLRGGVRVHDAAIQNCLAQALASVHSGFTNIRKLSLSLEF